MSKFHAFPLSSDDQPSYNASNETIFLQRQRPVRFVPCLHPSPSGTVSRHLGRATLSLSGSSSAHKTPTKRHGCTNSPPSLLIHRLPDSTDSFRHLSFPSALIPLSSVSTAYDQRPGAASSDKRRGPKLACCLFFFPSLFLAMLTLLITSSASSVFRSSFSCVLSFLFSLERAELGWGVWGNVWVGGGISSRKRLEVG